MTLKKGKIKNILESSMDAALLAVEVYNKPRVTFRCQNYISLMVIAWTYLFHGYFLKTIGNKYYHKQENGRYKIIDGERQAWELTTCINKFGTLREPIKNNLEFFIRLRNKIEHRRLENYEIDSVIIGECQSLLYNYENTLVELFGEKFALNEHLAFSLQFSTVRVDQQNQANKKAMSKEAKDIVEYISKYKAGLPDKVFESQEYSVKLIQIPKVSNTNRNDLAIEFVRYDGLNENEKEEFKQITTLIKDKLIVKETANIKRFKPSEVVREVNKHIVNENDKIERNHHAFLYKAFKIRPNNKSQGDPSETNAKYCVYDLTHQDYIYEQAWVDFIVSMFELGKLSREKLIKINRQKKTFDIDDFMSDKIVV